jgi:transposase-like protein
MRYCTALLETARQLASNTQSIVAHSDANRAVSTAYCAVFSCLAEIVANRLAGEIGAAGVNKKAWVKAYRSLDHQAARDAFLRAANLAEIAESGDIKTAATLFQRLQTARETADYDPSDPFTPDQASALIFEAQWVIEALSTAHPDILGVIVVEIVARTKQRQTS